MPSSQRVQLKDAYRIDLDRSLREVGRDGLRGTVRVQVKYHGGTSTTADLADPDQYDEVYLALGPTSVLRPKELTEDFLVYQFTAAAYETSSPRKLTATITAQRQGFQNSCAENRP
ncbi:MAG: hypothetical protein ACRD5H_04995 [Nitrososphaerales archaeon]